jgi:hypothetical protein
MSDELDELDGLMADLGAAQTSKRKPPERHAEFRQVFLATEVGKRVLHDILSWGHIWQTSIVSDPHMTYKKEGERNLALRILTTLHKQPSIGSDMQRAKEQ